MNSYPDIKTAISLWQESIHGNISWNTDVHSREYIFHTNGVGESALKIAGYCGLDSSKAYVLGLLHDYGKIQNEQQSGIAHFIYGYNAMKARGFDAIARVCITHSFPFNDIKFDDYKQYSIQDLQTAQSIIKNIEYDDYDRLIQLCDMFFEANNIVSYQQRLSCIRQRYNLSPQQTTTLEKGVEQNKAYFDAKCGCDIYKIINVRE